MKSISLLDNALMKNGHSKANASAVSDTITVAERACIMHKACFGYPLYIS